MFLLGQETLRVSLDGRLSPGMGEHLPRVPGTAGRPGSGESAVLS